MMKRLLGYYILLLGLLLIQSSFPIMAVAPRGTVPEIEIIRLNEKPIIDGELNDKAWLEVARSFKGVLTGWKNQYGTELIQNQRIVYMGYDADALYIGMICYVDDTDSLRYGNNVWKDDSLEVHIENTKGEYFQMGISCGGQWDIGRLDKIFFFDSASKIGDNYWSTEIAIPWEEIRVEPKPGMEIGFNFAGNDYKDYWVTWGPSYGSFQRPSTFSYFRLN